MSGCAPICSTNTRRPEQVRSYSVISLLTSFKGLLFWVCSGTTFSSIVPPSVISTLRLSSPSSFLCLSVSLCVFRCETIFLFKAGGTVQSCARANKIRCSGCSMQCKCCMNQSARQGRRERMNGSSISYIVLLYRMSKTRTCPAVFPFPLFQYAPIAILLPWSEIET